MIDIKITDALLDKQSQTSILNLLMDFGWAYGQVSGPSSTNPYWLKHFAGDKHDPSGKIIDAEKELEKTAPILFNLWKIIKSIFI